MAIDIDDLPRLCIDKLSSAYIDEAVRCYKNGAYRSCIISTWLAIVHNCICKIEELSLLGEPEAVSLHHRLIKIKTDNDIQGLLVFERSLLDVIKTKFQLIDDNTLIDFKRIQEDRHRCVHPLLTEDNEPFVPSPELAKNHMTVAVNKLLKEKSVYGKAVFDKVMDLIDSPYFPSKEAETKRVLDSSLLANPKDSLVSSVVVVIIKSMLSEDFNVRKYYAYQNVIKYLINKNYYLIEKIIREKINQIIDITNQASLKNLIHVLTLDNIIWQNISEDKKTLIKGFVSYLPSDFFDSIETWISLPELLPSVNHRVSIATREDISKSLFFIFPEILKDRLIQLYLESPNFKTANTFAKTVCEYIGDLGKEKVEYLLRKTKEFSQVRNSVELNNVIKKIRAENVFTCEEINRILSENDLAEYVQNGSQNGD